MIDLPDRCVAILRALASAASAWLSPVEVAELIGRGIDETTDDLAWLDESGWIEVWDRPEGIVATLSPLAAARLSVRLVEVGSEERPRWAPSGDPEPPAPRARHVCAASRGADLEFVVDPHELPESALERAEARPSGDRSPESRASRGFHWPTLVIGQDVSPWREVGPGPSCPGCGGAPLRPDAYCLCCGRWGHDGHLSEPWRADRTPADRPSIMPARTDPNRAEEARRADRLRRKSRRMSKLVGRISAESEARKRKRSGEPARGSYIVFAPGQGARVRAAGAGSS